ncbi:MAG: helix-turn-helix transcriptional regulator [Pseudonocardia sp.]|nr:helix-turn-helix transcriptional regulator [Pseudonocardia sp.]
MYVPLCTVEKATLLVSRLVDLDEPVGFAATVLPGLADLIGCDIATHTELGAGTSPSVRYSDHPPGSITKDVAEAFLRNFEQHPVATYYQRTGDGRALRMSDFLGVAEFHRGDLYHECYRPRPTEHILACHLPTASGSVSAFTLNRARGDFTDTERDLLDLLRRPLAVAWSRMRTRYAARQALAVTPPVRLDVLTERELQVLEQVALGHTSVAIGHMINCSARTVSKHLENIYRKLGVTNRAAAIATVRNTRPDRT